MKSLAINWKIWTYFNCVNIQSSPDRKSKRKISSYSDINTSETMEREKILHGGWSFWALKDSNSRQQLIRISCRLAELFQWWSKLKWSINEHIIFLICLCRLYETFIYSTFAAYKEVTTQKNLLWQYRVFKNSSWKHLIVVKDYTVRLPTCQISKLVKNLKFTQYMMSLSNIKFKIPKKKWLQRMSSLPVWRQQRGQDHPE